MQTIAALIQLLDLKQLSQTSFSGENYRTPWGRVFGGQVLAQALNAAYRTVPNGRLAHSLHGYFILGGNLDVPIRYEVDTIRDGGSFTTRRVVAYQKGKAIFTMGASFQVEESGVDHQLPMPEVPGPESLVSQFNQIEAIREARPKMYHRLKLTLPEIFEFRSIEDISTQLSRDNLPQNNLWMRAEGDINGGMPLQHQLLAYVSDYNLLATATLPHRSQLNKSRTFYASIDHAIWFHRDYDLQQWLLYSMDSPSSSNSRGFSRGNIFSRDGKLVASVAQEGLMRISGK